jgi:Na+/H+ antiporter NhaD/arsenite permease-like protein
MSNAVRMRKKSEYDKVLESINEPSHYKKEGIEFIDFMRKFLPRTMFIGALLFSIMKYLFRWDSKGITKEMDEEQKNLIKYENLGKAEFYLKELMRLHLPKSYGIPEYENVEIKDND